jgi:5'-3' exonuclease
MNILLVDLSNTLSVGTHAYPEARNLKGFRVGGIFYTLMKIRTLCARNRLDAVIACVDTARCEWRRALAPEYKGQRDAARSEKDTELHYASVKQRKKAHRVLVPCGITVARADQWEGDDVIAALALYKFRKHNIVIASSDKDFHQLVDGNRVRVFDIYNDKFREPHPHYCLKRCLDPKVSDNLNGVGGIGPKTADKLVAAWSESRKHKPPTGFDGVNDFLAWCEAQKDSSKPAAAIVAQQQIVRRNWKITDMVSNGKACLGHIKYRRGVYDYKLMEKRCAFYNIRPVISEASVYAPFFASLKDPRA